MKILWMTWKDRKNPLAGGAESVNEELAKRLVNDGHEVIFIVGGFNGAEKEEIIDGYKIIRLGNRFTVYWHAYRYYKHHLVGWADVVIDEVNTIPFFAKFYVKEKNIILCYQLCREIWFYQILFPLSLVGYLLEPFYLWLLRNQIVLTESDSTKKDLQKYGFKKDAISVFPIGLETEPAKDVTALSKYNNPTVLYLGAFRNMKRPLHAVKAFEIAKEKIPNMELIIAGDNGTHYGEKVMKYISNSVYKDSIHTLGHVSRDKKIELMQRSHVILVTSVKEGWGIIVTEANSQGTPAVVYDVDGLRDSVINNKTGLLCEENTPQAMAQKISRLFNNQTEYKTFQRNAWESSKKMTFDNSYQQFTLKINI